MKSHTRFYPLVALLLLVSASGFAQSFEETWKEFLDDDKISNISTLTRPNKVTDKADYAKYLLMNTNSRFCQSEVDRAEDLLKELQAMDRREVLPHVGLLPSM